MGAYFKNKKNNSVKNSDENYCNTIGVVLAATYTPPSYSVPSYIAPAVAKPVVVSAPIYTPTVVYAPPVATKPVASTSPMIQAQMSTAATPVVIAPAPVPVVVKPVYTPPVIVAATPVVATTPTYSPPIAAPITVSPVINTSGLTNVALGKPTKSQSLYNGVDLSAKAVDGDPSNSSYWAATPYPQWWQVDLGGLYKITVVSVRNYVDGRYYKYEILASQDGVNFAQIAAKINTNPATEQGDYYNVNVTARYFRVNVSYSSANMAVTICDFKAFGTPVVATAPIYTPPVAAPAPTPAPVPVVVKPVYTPPVIVAATPTYSPPAVSPMIQAQVSTSAPVYTPPIAPKPTVVYTPTYAPSVAKVITKQNYVDALGGLKVLASMTTDVKQSGYIKDAISGLEVMISLSI